MGLDSPMASEESPVPGASRRWADDEEADPRLTPLVPPCDSSGDRLTATIGSDPDHALCKEMRDTSMGESPGVKTTNLVIGETRTLHHRRAAGGLGTGQGGGRRALAGTRHSARADAESRATRDILSGRRTLKKHVLGPVFLSPFWLACLRDTHGTARVNARY